MMSYLKKVSSILAMVVLVVPMCEANTSLKCSKEERLGGKANRGADLKIVINKNGGIEKLDTSSFFASGKVGGGYFCGLNFPAPEVETRFEQRADTTLIFIDYENIGKSELRLMRTNTGYKLEFTNVNFQLCGAHAQFP